MLMENGLLGMITQQSWMFLSSYSEMREDLLCKGIHINMAHLGKRAFDDINGEIVNPVSFIYRPKYIANYSSLCMRLVDYNSSAKKREAYLSRKSQYEVKFKNFTRIPKSRFGYWLSDEVISSFEKQPLSSFIDARRGLQTGDSKKFIRKWYEVSPLSCGIPPYNTKAKNPFKWILFNSGGPYRKWYGNITDVVNWEDNGREIKDSGKAIIPSQHRYFSPVISWNKVSSGKLSVRYQPSGIIPGDASPFLHSETNDETILKYFQGLLNSKVVLEFINVLSPGLNFEVGNLSEIPVLMKDKDKVVNLVENCIKLSKEDWDLHETSWSFKANPLLKFALLGFDLKSATNKLIGEQKERVDQLKATEEQINYIFLNNYGFSNSISKVELSELTIPNLDSKSIVKEYLSYLIGCILGRYSLKEGLDASSDHYEIDLMDFESDFNNIIPINTIEYFEDDLIHSIISLIEITFGKINLQSNLQFIAEILDGKGSPREVIRRYFLNDFFKDHCKMYKNRPIYWLFDSGKKNGFKCLIYMHRYQPDTLARIRTDYVHEVQERYRSQIKHLQETIDSAPKSEQAKMKKELKDLEGKLAEVNVFEEKIHHLADQMISIDLDDGVKHNYDLFKDVLAKIK